MVGVLGAQLDYIDKETTWAHPFLNSVDEVLDIELKEDNFYYRTLADITRRSARLSKGHHYMGLFPLEGMTDILSGLYGTERFLMDLIAAPAAVKRAMEHVKRLWLEAFDKMEAIVTSQCGRERSSWANIWAPGSTFPIQEDASYMISNEMFREFCIPHITDIVQSLDYPIYHLDGVGAVNHLDSLLEIDSLRAIQWVPGAGQEQMRRWYDLITHILDANKSVQVLAKFETVEDVDALIENVGPKGLMIFCEDATNQLAETLEEKYSRD
jgi:hypothetical protein